MLCNTFAMGKKIVNVWPITLKYKISVSVSGFVFLFVYSSKLSFFFPLLFSSWCETESNIPQLSKPFPYPDSPGCRTGLIQS